ncbi:hypothetical protein [Arcobacter sp. LA11]|uniref:hypothetical protein n=1 Tax=Arcobacter sp. LA11 TaxID=1898176 RepID=UPI0009327B7C|nr:hypothetical protein [Arcobacter sp. LA11]
MKKMFKISSLVIVILFITGCTHKIEMTPNVEKITDSVSIYNTKNYNVAYNIKRYDQASYVVTPGGGGDKVGYTPYADTELAFRSVLVKIFKKVYKLDSISNKKFISEKDIKYIFTYNLKTNSSSDSMMTWPPTKFTISLNCKAIDNNGKNIWEKTFYDEGTASFDEFKNDFSLSAKRASEKVFSKMLIEINNSKDFD